MQTVYPATRKDSGDAVWVDLLNPTEEEHATVCAQYGVDVPTRHQLEEIESSSRLKVDRDSLVLSLPVATKSETGDSMPTPMGFVLSPRVLITVRFAEVHAIHPALESLRKQQSPTSADMFATVMEAMVDHSADMLEHIASELNMISQRVFKRYGRRHRNITRSNRALKETLVEVGEIGDHLSHIRDSILGLQRITPYALDKGQPWMGDAVLTRLKTVTQDVKSLADFEVHLTDKVQFLLDAVLGFINTEQNDIFKVLTIVSVVGIPPTFLASMWGMNFDSIHEYHWHYGYGFALTMIAVSTLLPIVWFKWRGWW